MFWKRLIYLCEDHHVKLPDVLNTLKIDAENITMWERGVIPNIEILIKLSDYFNVAIDYLLGYVDELDADRTITLHNYSVTDENLKKLSAAGYKFAYETIWEGCTNTKSVVLKKPVTKVSSANNDNKEINTLTEKEKN